MKIKKLLLISVVGAALALTGCNNKKPVSSSQQESSNPSSSEAEKPVKRLSVGKRPNVVVGDSIDFETLVEITYDDNTKDNKNFTLEVPAASEDYVDVTGHVVTFLKEGSASISVKAGAKTAKFSTSIVSRLKKDVTDAMNALSDQFGYMELSEQAGQLQAAPYATHDADYTAFAGWDDNDTPTVATDDLPGGFLKTQSGSTYSYVLDQNWQNIDVDPEPYGEFGNYYVNMPFSFDIAHAVTMEDEDTGVEYLHLDNTNPSGYSFFHDSVQEFCYCSLALYTGTFATSAIYLESIDIFEMQLSETMVRYALQVTAVQRSSGAKLDGGTYLLVYGTDTGMYGVQTVRNYIDSGMEPVGVDVTALKAKFDAVADAKNFTSHAEVTHIVEHESTDDEEELLCSEDILANEAMYERSFYDEEESAHTLVGTIGYVEHEGSLYEYQSTDGENYPAELVSEGGKVYVDKLDETLLAVTKAAYWSNFFAPTMKTEGGYDVYKVGVAKNRAFLAQLISEYACLFNTMGSWVDYAWTNYQVDMLSDSYTDAEISIKEGEVKIHIHMFAGVNEDTEETYYDFVGTITNVGTTAAITTPVTYPVAQFITTNQ